MSHNSNRRDVLDRLWRLGAKIRVQKDGELHITHPLDRRPVIVSSQGKDTPKRLLTMLRRAEKGGERGRG